MEELCLKSYDVICEEHKVFELSSKRTNRRECWKCKSKKKFIDKANRVHNSYYDYSQVDYVSTHAKVKIICPEHGIFEQAVYAHTRGQKCKKCYLNERVLGREEFIKRSTEVHQGKYNYDYVEYTKIKDKVKIYCPDHGFFMQIADDHQRGIGCAKCKSSHGERLVRGYLESKNITFEEQFKFDSCKYQRPLPFDFYLKDFNILIEYQGEQHFEPKNESRMFGSKNVMKAYQKIKTRDEIKLKWCAENNIKLVILTYKDNNNLIKILDREIK